MVIGAQSVRPTAPESFRASAQITAGGGGAASMIAIQIDRYTADADHAVLASVLKEQGYDKFLEALRKAPVIGAVKVGERSVPIRWAREQAKDDGRRIAVVTDGPVFFTGGGAANAKPTAGYDIAVLEFTVDAVGLGSGRMAPAARVKPGGPTGIEIDEYGGKLMTLATVARNPK
jgi:hypothetical protein